MVHRLRLFSLAFSLTIVSPLGGQATRLPHLQSAFVSTTLENAPVDRLTDLSVGPQGAVLFVSNLSDATRLVLVDSTGKTLLRFGHPGEGPGEVRSPAPVRVTTNTLAVWDRGTGRYTEWDMTGKVVRSVTPAAGISPFAVEKETIFGSRYVTGKWRPVALNATSGAIREIVPAQDSFLDMHFPVSAAGTSGSRYAPIFGRWSGGFIAADPATYRLALYRDDGTVLRVLGRDLPPLYASPARIDEFLATMVTRMGRGQLDEATKTRLRGEALKEPLPQITPGSPIQVDAARRIWTLGMEGDSAFADVFSETAFVGRIHLPCRLYNGKWSLAGRWLVAACLPDTDAFDGDAVLKLWRIVE